LTAYVRIDNRVAAAIAKLLVPLFGYLADRKLVEGIRVSAAIAEWAVEQPAEFCAWLAQEPLGPERRARILAALLPCREQSAWRGFRGGGTASPGTAPSPRPRRWDWSPGSPRSSRHPRAVPGVP